MSRHSVGWTVVAVAVVFAVGISLSGLTQHASGDQVLPGGHAAKIRSYHNNTQGGIGNPMMIIGAVEGDHGTILTDVVVGAGGGDVGLLWVQYKVADTWQTLFYWQQRGPTGLASLSLNSGIPVPKGAVVRVATDNAASVVLSGYIW